MNTTELLTAAKALIEDPRHWTQGVYARDRWGTAVSPYSPAAVAWCAAGAVGRTARHRGTYNGEAETQALEALGCVALKGNIVCDNDDVGHEQVMLDFDLAIKVTKEEAG